MLTLLVLLVALALVLWGARGVLAGLGAPPWLMQVLVAVVLLVALVIVANYFGIATPGLK